MGYRGHLTLPALTLCLAAVGPGSALAQPPVRPVERITELATLSTGQIAGQVRDEAGTPIEGVVVSALGSSNAFAVSDKSGQFSLRQLPPGPYLVRAHREGYLTVRGTIVEVRPSSRTPSSLTMHREGAASSPRIAEAGVGATAIGAAAVVEDGADERGESGLAWRLRRMKRSILRDTDTMAAVPKDEFSFTDPFEFLGRAMEQSARVAGDLFADIHLGGQVDLLTTGAFDSPSELLQMERTRSVAFFSVGSNVGEHGAWSVRAAMNQGDMDSWMVAGSYAARAGVTHRYHAGSSFSVQGYQNANTAVLATLPDARRNVGTVFAYDEWAVSPRVSLGYGANFSYYNYLVEPSLLSPRMTVSYMVTPAWRVRGLASRTLTAPGAQEFQPPTRASWLPPQRTFSPLSRDGFRTQSLEHYEVGADRVLAGATVGVRAFQQRIDDQMVTLFGFRRTGSPAAAVGHYYVGSMGDANVDGVGVSVSHALSAHVRGSVEYSFATADWVGGPPSADGALLARYLPALIDGAQRQQIHDVLTSVEAEMPQTATRMVLFYRLNNAFVGQDPGESDSDRGVDGRFELQVNQSLPFMNFMRSQWEMLVAVRNMFHESGPGASIYDEILVIRPPKRIVGGLTVRF
jgi:Carboxypeptidase regulatory-like domain/TonB dependent receptor